MPSSVKPTISFIIPLMNEAPSLDELYHRIAEQAREHARGWEILFIDDGSSDNSWEVIQSLSQLDPEHVRAIRFRRNRTKAPAMATGYKEATGEIVFTLDADLQDDPKEIPRFLAKLNEGEGWDIVSGYKEKRHDPWHKVLPSRIFNRLLSKVNGVNLHDHNCGFKCYRREVVQELPMYGEMHRMVPSLAAIKGFKTTEITVEHHARQHGESKYGWERLMRGFTDMWSIFFIKTFRERPLHFFTTVAFYCGGIAILLWLLALLPMADGLRTGLLSAAPAALFTAPVLIVIGLLAELLTYRHYKEGVDVPIIERIEGKAPTPNEKVVSLADAKDELRTESKPKIIVADDDPITRQLTTRIMQKEGWIVTTAQTGEEAMACISPNVDVILLDIYLPGISGLKVIPKLKQLSPKTQIVVLSGSEKATDGAEAIKAGGFDFLSKPVHKEELIKVLNNALRASRALRPEDQLVG